MPVVSDNCDLSHGVRITPDFILNAADVMSSKVILRGLSGSQNGS